MDEDNIIELKLIYRYENAKNVFCLTQFGIDFIQFHS